MSDPSTIAARFAEGRLSFARVSEVRPDTEPKQFHVVYTITASERRRKLGKLRKAIPTSLSVDEERTIAGAIAGCLHRAWKADPPSFFNAEDTTRSVGSRVDLVLTSLLTVSDNQSEEQLKDLIPGYLDSYSKKVKAHPGKPHSHLIWEPPEPSASDTDREISLIMGEKPSGQGGLQGVFIDFKSKADSSANPQATTTDEASTSAS